MRHNEKVIYCSTEWFFIKEIDKKYLLRSINKNIDDVLVEPQYVKKFEERIQKSKTDKKVWLVVTEN